MALVPLSTVDPGALRWLRTAQRPVEFTLSSGDAEIARLAWTRESGGHAVSTSAGGTLRLEHRGFLNPTVVALADGRPSPLARLTVHLQHHEIEIAGGPTYRFHRAGVLLPAWRVTYADGAEVLHVEAAREGRELSAGAVIVAPSAATRPELLLLVLLSWYFVVVAWFEDEALQPLERLQDAAPGFL